MSSLAVTVVGHDRPGIIAEVAAALADAGMNLEDSVMTRLRGHFAMTLICAGASSAAAVETRLAGLRDPALAVDVRDLPDDPADEVEASHLVTVHGADRLGIVARLTGEVAAAGGNITDLSTRLAGPLYVLLAEVSLSEAADADQLAAVLQAAAAELGVEVSVRPLEPDEL